MITGSEVGHILAFVAFIIVCLALKLIFGKKFNLFVEGIIFVIFLYFIILPVISILFGMLIFESFIISIIMWYLISLICIIYQVMAGEMDMGEKLIWLSLCIFLGPIGIIACIIFMSYKNYHDLKEL